ncbi:gata transcription [Lentinula edodes]|uniref:Gata transcription n=1 Tax=Lentinula edodes TaxID=5353 RepID=A0A1Q3ESB0_LENED|nr:gata transcription [Lentinula edodes]
MDTFQLRDENEPSNSVQNISRSFDEPSTSSVFEDASIFQNDTPSPHPTPSSSSSVHLPEIAQQRCYWALLSAHLVFLYLDPIMQVDLGGTVVGRSLLEFVHPDEQSTARLDLSQVLESKTVHGSITHVRFSRPSRIRRELRKDDFRYSDKVYLDEDFIAVDLVINCAAEGLVLCFIHATPDIDPVSDNDERVKSSWSNWCSTPYISEEQLRHLSHNLLIPSLFTWPPPQEGSSEKDFTDLAKSVEFRQSGSSISQAKTNCTRRFKALQELHGTDVVESVFIPHGSVIFACHKVSTSPSSLSSSAHSQPINPTIPILNSPNYTTAFMGYNGPSSTSYSLPPPPPHQQPFYDSQYSLPPLTSSTTLPPPTSTYSYASGQPTLPASSQYSYAHWANPDSHSSVQSLRSGYWSHGSASYENGSSVSAPLPMSGGHQSHGNYGRPFSPYDGLNGNTPSPTSATSSTADLVPPSRRRISPSLSPEHRGSNGATGGPQRTHGNRPTGLIKCSSCKTTSSPEWRKGPSGKKELCNACGLRYARSRAKKEGHVVSNSGRKRKDKIIKRESSTPPSATDTISFIIYSSIYKRWVVETVVCVDLRQYRLIFWERHLWRFPERRDREGYPPTPVSAEPRASYYEASYNRGERKDALCGYEKEYEREYDHEERGRSLVTG